MFYVKFCLFLCILAVLLMGCQEVTDDLAPSGRDKRPTVNLGSIGSEPGQLAPAFTVVDTRNNNHTLNEELVQADGVVLYFTMWCPICDSHMSHIRSHLVSDFPNVSFFIIDYVNGSVAASRAAQLANGYANFTVLVDSNQALFDAFKGGMGVAVVVDRDGTVRLNEDYKNGRKVRGALEALL